MPRPRQEFVEAFDDDVFPAGTAAPATRPRPGGPAPQRAGRFPETGPSTGDGAGGSGGGDGPNGDGGAGGDGGDGGEGRPGRQARRPGPRARGERPGKARAFTGAAAAAVTTVLAIVVAGQVAGGGPGTDTAPVIGGGQRDTSEGSSRTDDRKAAKPPPRAERRLSYAEKLALKEPLDPGLAGPDSFRSVGAPDRGAGKGQVLRYRVDVEDGLPLDGELFADAVHRTLNDERSWAHEGARTFDRVGGAEADFVITLASPGTTAIWCAKSGLDTTVDNVSCDSASTRRVMINAYRWAQGARTFGDDIAHYREMLINHEVGHRLGLNHQGCSAEGALAPVMMQQTKSLTTAGTTCLPNAWPFP
ncbi:DUF3152 domain-containing protein [Streptomyces zingiberis]|uniref:DUF3152 domain-containing protein n=1 Tax=Streptomyces zingiberis TaxID=2053010 RepID=UPI0028937AF4|nr:DUF3152 domain-containing protein [Streptomyces zingiberis]